MATDLGTRSLTDAQCRQYLQNPTTCPACRAEGVVEQAIDCDEPHTRAFCTYCYGCTRRWLVLYRPAYAEPWENRECCSILTSR